MITCRYCDSQHGDLLLCLPAKRVLDALWAHGQRFDMPTVEFPEPIYGADMLGPARVLVQQFVVKGATIEVAGTQRPTLIFTGQEMGGKVLPEWVYPGTPEEIGKAVDLVSDMAEMAIRRARGQLCGATQAPHGSA